VLIIYLASPKIRLATDANNVNIRKQPNTDTDNIECVVSTDDTDFIYYGDIVGSAPTANITKWYYVRLITGDIVHYGYVYSVYVKADTIFDNIIEEMPNENDNGDVTNKPTLLEGTTLYIFIAALSIPAVLIIYLLFKKRTPTKKSGD